MYKVKHVL